MQKQDSGISVNTKSLKSKKEEKKATSVKGKAKSVFMEKSIDLQGSGYVCEKEKEKSQDIGTENKLVTTKPWF